MDGKKKILIADDSRDFTQVYGSVLERRGFDVRVANNGSECMRQVAAEKPNLILLDVQMPDMDGGEVLDFLAEDENTKDIPVVMLSGLVAPENSGFEMHGICYMSKLDDVETVVDRISSKLETPSA